MSAGAGLTTNVGANRREGQRVRPPAGTPGEIEGCGQDMRYASGPIDGAISESVGSMQKRRCESIRAVARRVCGSAASGTAPVISGFSVSKSHIVVDRIIGPYCGKLQQGNVGGGITKRKQAALRR